MAAQQAANQKAFNEASAARAQAAANAEAARNAAHQQELAARLAKDREMEEAHKKEMAEKKAAFEAQFKHVWGSTATGLSFVSCVVENEAQANELLANLFAKTLIADAHSFKKVQKIWKASLVGDSRSHTKKDYFQRLNLITSDDRVAELIEAIVAQTKNEKADVLVRQMTAASKEYNTWAKKQCEAQSEENAYYKDNAFANNTPVSSETVARLEHFHTQ